MKETVSQKDIQRYYNCSPRTAWFKINKVRYELGKPKRATVTAHEFAKVHHIDPEKLIANINKNHKSLL